MSLLMQALKKAERARQSGLQEEEVPLADVPLPDVPADEAAPPVDVAAPRAPAPSAGGLELSLEPLDAPPPRAAPPAAATEPPIEPAVEAAHDPVPPQARHDSARPRPPRDDVPPAAERGAPRPSMPPPEPERRGPGAPERRAVPRAPRVRTEAAAGGIDMQRVRLVVLTSILLIVVATFVFLYRQALTGPGPGASLPMVPMPPPSATGAAAPGGAVGIVVPPAGPPFGPLTAQPATPPAVAEAPATTVAPAVATPSPAPSSAPAPAPRRSTPSPTPTLAQLASIQDPEIRREAMRDAADRAERELREQVGPATSVTAAGPRGSAVVPAAPDGDVRVARGAGRASVPPGVLAGYTAFAAGDLSTARQQYAAALRDDPNNRDALLGSAAVARREGRDADAADLYTRMLAQNPRDADALGGLTALRPGDGDQAEIRLKGVLRTNPDAAAVHFALGNLYARQRRWQEAQQAYFRAWSGAPANADYAFNLAVGLDRLNQSRLAVEYYQRALALAASSPAAFDREAAQRRLVELAGTPQPAAPAPAAPGAGN